MTATVSNKFITLLLALLCSWTANVHANANKRYVLIEGSTAVYDGNTNLIWKRCQEGKYWAEGFCKGIGKELNWEEAMRAARNGWRLPTINELKTLSQPPNTEGIWIDSQYFPDTDPGTYWSSTASEFSAEAAWDFNFRQGHPFGGANRTYKSHVRLVRTKSWRDFQLWLPKMQAAPKQETTRLRYSVMGNDDIVLDRRTGLLWKRCQEGKHFADGSCAGNPMKVIWQVANQARSDGWRLPTKGELKSLIELGPANTTSINEKFFPNTEPWEFWTSSPSETNPGAVWAVDFGNGHDFGNVVRFHEHYVRLVKTSPN
jgi:hypothetical protein